MSSWDTLQECIEDVQDLTAKLKEPGTDVRLTLYMIRMAAWRAITHIDHAAMADYYATHNRLSERLQQANFTIEDL